MIELKTIVTSRDKELHLRISLLDKIIVLLACSCLCNLQVNAFGIHGNGLPINNDRKLVWTPSSSTARTTLRTIFELRMSVSSKTGGKLIENANDFNAYILDEGVQTTSAQTSNRRPAMVFWTAPWCGPCRLSIPVVKDVMKQFASKIDLYEICTDDLPEVAADAGVVSVPTIHLYYNGKQFDTIIGCVAKTVLASAVEKFLEDIALKQGGS